MSEAEINIANFYETLPSQTKLEMARGALGNATDLRQAEEFVRTLGIVADGERVLKKLIAKSELVSDIRANVNKDGVVSITIRSRHADEPLVLTDTLKGFPSGTIKTQVMLVAG